MAFNVLAQIATGIPTVKDNETVDVQIVQITTNRGDVRNRVEARIIVDSDNYNGPTKVALVFDDAAAVTRLIEGLTEAATQFGNIGAGFIQQPVVKKARQRRAVAPKKVA